MNNEQKMKTSTPSAFDKAVSILARRMRTEKQLRDALAGVGVRAAGYSGEEIDVAIFRLQELGYIDDAAYAERCLEILIEKKRGRRRIAEEMRRHGLCTTLVNEALEAGYPADTEKENALYVARKKLESLDPDMERRAKAQKVSSRLLSQGYGYDLANYAIDTLL